MLSRGVSRGRAVIADASAANSATYNTACNTSRRWITLRHVGAGFEIALRTSRRRAELDLPVDIVKKVCLRGRAVGGVSRGKGATCRGQKDFSHAFTGQALTPLISAT